ncbi:MAG: protein-L-isoaspartate(D-aspartate) O-methyltransferase [Myxococcota bacterium]
MDFAEQRHAMVERQLIGRGISAGAVLEAFREVPREAFLPERLREFAYEDSPLPIDEGQTISQPYIVAFALQALALQGGERVLEIGTGSGYAAAILSRIVKQVFSVERLPALLDGARRNIEKLGYRNVTLLLGDGTLGWQEYAPYDAIVVAAGGPEVPSALLSQLTIGGRLVMPVGPESEQKLVRITRDGPRDFRRDVLTHVRFVPLIGEQGWPIEKARPRSRVPITDAKLPSLVRESAEAFDDLETADLDAFLDRVGDARLVLLGESTHGSSEFYRMRARISRELIEHRGFDFVAVEADWPDAARVDAWVMGHKPVSRVDFTPFSRFPTWMWKNEEVHAFATWLRAHNRRLKTRASGHRVGFHGLDLYSMFTSIAAVLTYLDDVDAEAARSARARYGRLTPWQQDPIAYGRAVLAGRYESSEQAVVAMLRDLLARRLEYSAADGERFFDAAQNARVVANAEKYYRSIYYGSVTSWNLRDSHMFDTLESLLAYYGPDSRGIVWEHNSHVGDAAATEMKARGEHNVGELCRKKYGNAVYIVGFGTDHGTVAAAHDWDEPMQRMSVRPARADSYERVFHDTGLHAFLLPLRQPKQEAVREELMEARLERAIGVVYRPDTERQSHYFRAELPRQFDEFIWFDETRAVAAIEGPSEHAGDLPETYPFGV